MKPILNIQNDDSIGTWKGFDKKKYKHRSLREITIVCGYSWEWNWQDFSSRNVLISHGWWMPSRYHRGVFNV